MSLGIQKVKVPDLTNYTADEAEEALKSRGLTAELKKVRVLRRNIKANHVVRTDPEIDTEVPVGSSVTVYVSMGIAVEEADVPNLVGMSLEAATKESGAATSRLKLRKRRRIEKDQVIEQDPEPGGV